jgi:hypothetical protein
MAYYAEDKNWNRCDTCGKFIGIFDFDRGAVRRLVTPDSHWSKETWETLCIEHAHQQSTPSKE